MSKIWRLVIVFCLGVCGAIPPCLGAGPPLDLVVMVKAGKGPGTRTEVGAGLVVSQTAARTVVVTALHVVRDQEQVNAKDISVEFSMLRGKVFRATMSPDYVDEAIDLAVLFIDHATVAAVPRLSEARLAQAVSPSAAKELPGAKVQVVGANGGPWTVGPSGDTIVREVAYMLRVRSTEARAGASGGGVFDAFGRLLGMNSFLHGETGELVVVPMAVIQQRLQRWSLEYNLGTAGAPTGSKELLAALERTTQLTVRAIPGGATGLYAMTLAVPDALARLQPTFRIVFTDVLTLQPVELRALGYSAQVMLPPVSLTAQLWMDTPDGRKTGPVRQIFEIEALATTALADKNAHDQAMGKASILNGQNYFRSNEEFARKQKARELEVLTAIGKSEALSFEKSLLESLLRTFPNWSLRCGPALSPAARRALSERALAVSSVQQSWRCDQVFFLGRKLVHGRMDHVIHAMRIGESPTRLTVQVPVDHSVVDVDAFIKTEVERLLTEGKTTIHVDVALTDGRRLGPKALCEVRRRTPSLPLLVCEPAVAK